MPAGAGGGGRSLDPWRCLRVGQRFQQIPARFIWSFILIPACWGRSRKKSLQFPFPPKSGDTREGAPVWDPRASLALCCYHQRVPRGEFNHRQAEQKGTGASNMGRDAVKAPGKCHIWLCHKTPLQAASCARHLVGTLPSGAALGRAPAEDTHRNFCN